MYLSSKHAEMHSKASPLLKENAFLTLVATCFLARLVGLVELAVMKMTTFRINLGHLGAELSVLR
jgi:hypothetical protein